MHCSIFSSKLLGVDPEEGQLSIICLLINVKIPVDGNAVLKPSDLWIFTWTIRFFETNKFKDRPKINKLKMKFKWCQTKNKYGHRL